MDLAERMADMMCDAKASGYRRVEVLTGPRRRRDWSDDDKARALAESCVPGTVVSAVARRWQIAPQQLFTWRRQARAAALVETTSGLSFVPIVPEPPASMPDAAASSALAGSSLEVELAGAVLRVAAGTDAELLTVVLRAVRASAG
jgi:transposase